MAAVTRLNGWRCDGDPESAAHPWVTVADLRRETGLAKKGLVVALHELEQRGSVQTRDGRRGRLEVEADPEDVRQRWTDQRRRISYTTCLLDRGLRHNTVLLIGFVAGQTREAFPRLTYGRQTLSNLLGLAPRSLDRAMAQAKEEGLLRRWTHDGTTYTQVASDRRESGERRAPERRASRPRLATDQVQNGEDTSGTPAAGVLHQTPVLPIPQAGVDETQAIEASPRRPTTPADTALDDGRDTLRALDLAAIERAWIAVADLVPLNGSQGLSAVERNTRREWKSPTPRAADQWLIHLETKAGELEQTGLEGIADALRRVGAVLSGDAADRVWTVLVLLTIAAVHRGRRWRSRRVALAARVAGSESPDTVLTALLLAIERYRPLNAGAYLARVVEHDVAPLVFGDTKNRLGASAMQPVGFTTSLDSLRARNILAVAQAVGDRRDPRACADQTIEELRDEFWAAARRRDWAGAGQIVVEGLGPNVTDDVAALADRLRMSSPSDKFALYRAVTAWKASG